MCFLITHAQHLQNTCLQSLPASLRQSGEGEESVDCTGNLAAVLEFLAGEDDGGTFIVGAPLGQAFAHGGADLILAFAGHQRSPRVVGHQPGHRSLLRGLEPDGQPPAEHIVHVAGVTGGATTAGHHHIAELADLAQHGRLHAAELRLTLPSEDVADAEPEALLYIEIEVDEIPTGGAGEGAAERGLSAGHIADDEYRSLSADVHGVFLL